MKYKIMVVDDDASILRMLVQSLEASDYLVRTATNGRDAIRDLTDSKPDLVVLDWNLPEMTGLQICQFLRAHPPLSKIPVLMLTAFSSSREKVSAFDVGADDYLTKPFDVPEFLARIKALLRRGANEVSEKDTVQVGAVILSRSSHAVTVKGRLVELRPKEFELLEVLMKAQGQVVSRRQLLERVWGYDAPDLTTRTVDSHIARLRDKLGSIGAGIIQTIPGFGYKAEDPK